MNMLNVASTWSQERKRPCQGLVQGRWFRPSSGRNWGLVDKQGVLTTAQLLVHRKHPVALVKMKCYFFYFFLKNFLKVFLSILIQFKSVRQEGLRAAMPATLANQTPKKHSIPLRRALENGLLMVAFKINWGLPGWMDSLRGLWPGSRLVPSGLTSCWVGGPLIKHGCLACAPFSRDEVESLVPSLPSCIITGETEAQESQEKSDNSSRCTAHFLLTYLQRSRQGSLWHSDTARYSFSSWFWLSEAVWSCISN